MRTRDIIGRRIINLSYEQIRGDREYHGPPVICTSLTLDDGTVLVCHASETSDSPVAYLGSIKAKIKKSKDCPHPESRIRGRGSRRTCADCGQLV